VPHLELSAEVELPDGVEMTSARIVRACAGALREVPIANASYRDGKFELFSRVNIGIVVPSQDALVIPTLFDADAKTPDELGGEIADLSQRAAAGQLAAPELAGATFTLWPVNEPAVASLMPLIVPPQAAAIGAGPVQRKAVVRNQTTVPGRTMSLALACDSRILYGAEAERFLREASLNLQAG
jgi:pyruvate dehydrogenase E2 component (dihydrolipoamide acetyltransferase)